MHHQIIWKKNSVLKEVQRISYYIIWNTRVWRSDRKLSVSVLVLAEILVSVCISVSVSVSFNLSVSAKNRNICYLTIMRWGTNNKNINIDGRKWLTSTTFSTQRNINIEKVCRRFSRFFFMARLNVDVNLRPIRKCKKRNGNNVECQYIRGL